MAKGNSIEETLNAKIADIKAQQEVLAEELKHWQKVASDYETYKVTIESILSVHSAPDLAVKKTRKPRQKKIDGGSF